MASTTDVLDHHIKCFGEGDLEGILADYAPEAILFTPDGPLNGTRRDQAVLQGDACGIRQARYRVQHEAAVRRRATFRTCSGPQRLPTTSTRWARTHRWCGTARSWLSHSPRRSRLSTERRSAKPTQTRKGFSIARLSVSNYGVKAALSHHGHSLGRHQQFEESFRARRIRRLGGDACRENRHALHFRGQRPDVVDTLHRPQLADLLESDPASPEATRSPATPFSTLIVFGAACSATPSFGNNSFVR